MPRPVVVILFCAAALAQVAAVAANVDDRRRTVDPVEDLVCVAVTTDGHAIVLATLALPQTSIRAVFGLQVQATDWRFRILRLTRGAPRVEAAWLATSATKLLVRFANGAYRVLDLTAPILQFDPTATQTSRPRTAASDSLFRPHHLPSERFIVDTPSGAVVKDDDGDDVADAFGTLSAETQACVSQMVRAQVSGTTTVLIARDGSICRTEHVGHANAVTTRLKATAPAPETVTALMSDDGLSVRLIASAAAPDERRFRVIDADSASTRAALYANRTTAALHAALDLGHDKTHYSSSFLDTLADRLDGAAAEALRHSGFITTVQPWMFYRPRLLAALYAPVVELAPAEDVTPSPFNVWTGIDDEVAGDSRFLSGDKNQREQALFEAYRRRFGSDVRTKPAAIYWTALSYPGTWLIEFWLYYPFDRGPGGHLHDSEHVFVEVDKLGGFVRQVIGTAHGALTANNIYRTTAIPDVPPILLPLYVIVEKGKHASAPDIDRDGAFSVAADVNVVTDRAKVWGIRDDMPISNIHLRSYEDSMTLKRDVRGQRAPAAFAEYYDWFCGSENRPRCDVQLLPLDMTVHPTCDKNTPATEACAMHEIVEDEDAIHVFKALKPAFAGTHFLRAGYSRTPAVTSDSAISLHGFAIGGAVELSEVLPALAAVPGRVSGETLVRWTKNGPSWGGVIVHYERLLTSLYGYYVGLDALREEDTSSPKPHETAFRGWLTFGPMFEYAFYPHLNINVQGGIAYTNSVGIQPEVRVSFAFVATNHANFGGRRDDVIP